MTLASRRLLTDELSKNSCKQSTTELQAHFEMSREGFQIPSNLDVAAAGTSQARAATLKYICAECSSKLSLSRTDPVRCKDCGHRILLKARTKRMVQFEAR